MRRDSLNALVSLGVIALAVLVFGPGRAAAQGRLHRIPVEDPPRYVLNAPGTWGDAQDAAVANATGLLLYKHVQTGIGVVESDDPQFLDRALASGAFSGGAVDIKTRWESPLSSFSADDDATTAAITPGNEPYINAEWNLTAIDAPGAWAAGYDGSGVRVAVLDGGICATHADLAANLDIAASRSFVEGKGFDQDGAGFKTACHVAGIIAALDNNIGTIGIAPGAKIVVCKVIDGGFGTFESIIEGILYAATPLADGGGGADIMVISPAATFDKGGGANGTGQLISAFNNAINFATNHGVLVVAAAGNQGIDLDHSGNTVVLPGDAASAIAISATGPVGFAVGYPNGATNFSRPSSYTNFGQSTIWIAAPGGDDALGTSDFCHIPKVPSGNFTFQCHVFDQVPSSGFVTTTGTSISTWGQGTAVAAAHVAGVAALIKQRFPGISVGQLKNQLKNSATPPGGGGVDPYLGHGFLNARKAVTNALAAEDASMGSGPGQVAARPAIGPALALTASRTSEGARFVMALGRAGRARLDVMDIAGRRIAVVHDGLAQAGQTSITWNGNGVNGRRVRPGAYFARLASPDGVAHALVIVR